MHTYIHYRSVYFILLIFMVNLFHLWLSNVSSFEKNVKVNFTFALRDAACISGGGRAGRVKNYVSQNFEVYLTTN